WFSRDGRTWRATNSTNPGYLLAMPNTFYATGYAMNGSPAVYQTSDGSHWELKSIIVSHPQSLNMADLSLERLGCFNHRLGAVGLQGRGPANQREIGWSSRDGVHWSRIKGDTGQLHRIHYSDQPSLSGTGPAGTAAIAPWGDGWVGSKIWLHPTR